jgi:hypothetical protein
MPSMTFNEVESLLEKQMKAVDSGRANLDVANAQANLAGKWVRIKALRLAEAAFRKSSDTITAGLEDLAKKQIST